MKSKICEHCGMETLYISWSSLRVHEECAQKGKLYKSGNRATLADSRGFFPGTVVDRVMRDWLADEPEKNPGLMPEMVESIMAREETEIKENGGKLSWKDINDKNTVLETCIEAAKKLEPHLNELVLPYNYQPAMRFQAPLWIPDLSGQETRIVLRGEMDIIVQDPEDELFSIWDLKITRDNNYWRKTTGQLTFYDLANFSMHGTNTKMAGLIQPLCKQEVLPYPISENARMELLTRITNYAHSYWLEDHPPRQDNTICGFCDVKHACSKFKPVNDGNKRVVGFGL